MLSHLKSRDLAPAPMETESTNIVKQEPATIVNNKVLESEQQAAARLTCDALCSLASVSSRGHTPSLATAATATATILPSSIPPGQPLGMHGFLYVDRSRSVAAPTAAVSTSPQPASITSSNSSSTASSSTASSSTAKKHEYQTSTSTSPKIKSCPKQHQLPLFLSKTYHMIDRCDKEIATWSATGDNFVVKNVEKFASAVLPLYFKHSNFSSFARQLNFYGFRKLRSDPILTNDVDPHTACYVRFYHEKFQKDRPELLHSIKRATKSDQQSKDDVDDLKSQVFKLKKCVVNMSTEMERKISEINYEYNRRISGLTAEYDKLAGLVAQLLQQHQQQQLNPQYSQSQQQQHLPTNYVAAAPSHHIHHVPNPPLPPVVETTTTVPITTRSATTSSMNGGGLLPTPSSSSSSASAQQAVGAAAPLEQQKMQSLSQVVAMSLMATSLIPAAAMTAGATTTTTSIKTETVSSSIGDDGGGGTKRAATENIASLEAQPPAIRPKIE